MTIVFTAPPNDVLVSDLIEETKRFLIGTQAQQLNMLNAGMAATDTQFATTYPLNGIGPGSYLAVDDEIMYVWVSTNTGNTVTVQRGMLGTTAATHLAGAIVEVNPRYPNSSIRNALKEEIRSWGPQVYTVKSTTIQTTEDVRGYDLAQLVNDNFYQIMSVRHSTPVTTGTPDPMSWPKIQQWQVIRGAPTSDFPSGSGLVIPTMYESGTNWASSDGISLTYTSTPLPTLNVVYSAPFDVDNFTDSTSALLTVGLDATMVDIPPLGAAWRLMWAKESQRLSWESMAQPADLQYHPPLYASKAAQALKELRDSRLNDAQIWLINRYGIENWGI